MRAFSSAWVANCHRIFSKSAAPPEGDDREETSPLHLRRMRCTPCSESQSSASSVILPDPSMRIIRVGIFNSPGKKRNSFIGAGKWVFPSRTNKVPLSTLREIPCPAKIRGRDCFSRLFRRGINSRALSRQHRQRSAHSYPDACSTRKLLGRGLDCFLRVSGIFRTQQKKGTATKSIRLILSIFRPF